MKLLKIIFVFIFLFSLLSINLSIEVSNKNQNSLQPEAENINQDIQISESNDKQLQSKIIEMQVSNNNNTQNNSNTNTSSNSQQQQSPNSNSFNNTNNNGTKKSNTTDDTEEEKGEKPDSDDVKDAEKSQSKMDIIKDKLKGVEISDVQKKAKKLLARGLFQREEAQMKKLEMCYPNNNCTGNGVCSKCDNNVDCSGYYICNCNEGYFGKSCEYNNQTFNDTVQQTAKAIKKLKSIKHFNTTKDLFQAYESNQDLFQNGALNVTIQKEQIDLLTVLLLYTSSANQMKFVMKLFSDVAQINENVPPLNDTSDENIKNITDQMLKNQLKVVDFYKQVVQNYGQDKINAKNQTFFFDDDQVRLFLQYVYKENFTLNVNSSTIINVTTGFLQLQQDTFTVEVNTTDPTFTLYTIEMPESANQNISLPTQIEALPSPYVTFTDALFYTIKSPTDNFNLSNYNLQASLVMHSRDQVKYIKNAENLVSQIVIFQLVFADKNSSNNVNSTYAVESDSLPEGQCINIYIPRDIELETALDMVKANKECVVMSNEDKSFKETDSCKLVGLTPDNEYYQCCCSDLDPLKTTFAIKYALINNVKFLMLLGLILLGLLFA